MKSYTVTVNGVVYDVTVEDKANAETTVGMQRTPVMPQAPVSAPAPAPASAAKGAKAVTAGAAGKILKVNVKVGDKVTVGQTVAMLEVMKMETPIVSSDEGVVASIEIKDGDSVEAGATLVTLN